jgi:hypothetical protein
VSRAYGSRTASLRTAIAVRVGLTVCGNGWLKYRFLSSSPEANARTLTSTHRRRVQRRPPSRTAVFADCQASIFLN